ncbi:MAG: transcription antitermination protein NusB [Oscillatoriales cyanobacterium SM2_2_1]|nr:transcription antitermination protein NusB [Oscillatoriales cyanobacterium SM2_2_1]
MQARHVARELALLCMGQLSTHADDLSGPSLENILTAVVQALTEETREILLQASANAQRIQDKLLDSETRSGDPRSDLKVSQSLMREALEQTRIAINRLGKALDFPPTLQFAQHQDVRSYTLKLLGTVHKMRSPIDETLSQAMVDWQLNRLAHLDRDLLRLAVAEMHYLQVPHNIVINEIVELAKQYSSEDGYRFINGVLRRVHEQNKVKKPAN